MILLMRVVVLCVAHVEYEALAKIATSCPAVQVHEMYDAGTEGVRGIGLEVACAEFEVL